MHDVIVVMSIHADNADNEGGVTRVDPYARLLLPYKKNILKEKREKE